MTGTTDTASQVTSTTTVTGTHDDVLCSSSNARQSWACINCRLSFHDGTAYREHMKSPWHVYNLKRRIASLPPTSLGVFNTQVRPLSEQVEESTAGETINRTERDVAVQYRCLFCPWTFDSDDQGLPDNLKHMSVAHGFFIPDITLVLDLEVFLAYLAIAVREWHECLYCGIVRGCTEAAQSHMRDKAHCKLNLDREPELLEFWEEKGDIVPVKAFSGELVLPSGRSAASGASQHRKTKAARGTAVALRTDTLPRNKDCRQLSRRDEMGMQSVGHQQRRSLVLAVKRSQKEESIASRASEWSHAQKANKQKHDQAHGPLSWAKGGMHNLLPR